MRGLLLAAAAAFTVVFGYLMMKKLDGFLQKNRLDQASLYPSGNHSLHIGFSNPLVADSLAESLERYAVKCPDVSVHLYSGSEEELVQGICTKQLDAVFLPNVEKNLTRGQYQSRQILLSRIPNDTRYSGLPVEPMETGAVKQHIVWLNTPEKPWVSELAECLQGELWER